MHRSKIGDRVRIKETMRINNYPNDAIVIKKGTEGVIINRYEIRRPTNDCRSDDIEDCMDVRLTNGDIIRNESVLDWERV